MALAFHPGGLVAAILDKGRTGVRLIEVETGRVMASLEPPEPVTSVRSPSAPTAETSPCRVPDQRVQIWDLGRSAASWTSWDWRRGLPDVFGEGGGTASGDAAVIDRIEVDGVAPAELKRLAIHGLLREAWIEFRALSDPRLEDAEELVARGGRWEGLGQWRLAAADYRAALARRPDAYTANHALARLIAEEPGRGDPEEAVQRARFAVGRWRGSRGYFRTLALALYRAGRFAEAAEELESNIRRNHKDAGLDRLILAMSRWRMGQNAAARAALAEALRWPTVNPDFYRDHVAAFERLRREAESVLGGTLPDLPADVFAR